MRDERDEDKTEQEGNDEESKGEVKTRGRPMNIECLGKERSANAGKIDELMKRKRERIEEKGVIGNEKEIFKDSKKIARSPVKADGARTKDDELLSLIKAMRIEMREEIEEGKRRSEVQEKWLRAEIGELKEEVKRKADRMEKELEKIKMEMKVGEKNQEEESKKRSGEEKNIKKRIEKIEMKMSEGENGTSNNGTMKRIEEMERKWERVERDSRRKNIIMKGIRTDAGDNNNKVKMILNEIGIEEGIGEINMLNKERGVAIVKLENMETKKKVMREKRKLVGRRERIEDDMTWRERDMQNKIYRTAYEERKKGCKVWVKYGRIEINAKWWKWDEQKGVLRDNNGRERNAVEQERLSGEEEVRGKYRIMKKENKDELRREKVEIVWWNVAGVINKNREFWNRLTDWDVIVMMETWMEEKGWSKVKNCLPDGFTWSMQLAKRENKKGRAKGGMIVGIKKELRKGSEWIKWKEKGLVEVTINMNGEIWNIIGIYINNDIERKLECLDEWTEKEQEGKKISIGGDFNARTGCEGYGE